MAKSKGNKNAEYDPSNDIDTNSEMITCSFNLTKEQVLEIDIVKLNAIPMWSFEEKDGKAMARGKVLSTFEDRYESILNEGGDYLKGLVKRSFNIDLQRDERESVKQRLGLVKQTTRVSLSNYKDGVLEKLLKTGMSREEALSIINS